MKKYLRPFITVLTVISILTMSVISSNAVTYYTFNGYTYRNIANGKISLCGWDNKSNTLVIPEKIGNDYFVSVSDYAFEDNNVIEYVDFSNATSLYAIGCNSFEGCTALKSITLPEWITSVDSYAFQDCTALESAEINANISKVSVQMFNRCSSLASVKLSDSIVSIEKFAFGYCPSLHEIVIPDSVTSISVNAFYDDTDLTIYCNKDSYAHEYAKKYGFKYVLLDSYNQGDVNRDGDVNILDATLVQKYLVELENLDHEQFALADMDFNNELDITDVTDIQILINNT